MKQIVRNKKTNEVLTVEAVNAREYVRVKDSEWELLDAEPVEEVVVPIPLDTAGKKIKPKRAKK